jgi:MerR family copper efflux transcriptional regulator
MSRKQPVAVAATRTAAAEMTIGKLAKRARVAPSLLRYYEKEGLLPAARRTASGYRLYGPAAEKTLLFINRAKRLGFSLDDIRRFLKASPVDVVPPGDSRREVTRIARERFVEIERRLTELLVLRHELEVFLREISGQFGGHDDGARPLYRRLVDHACGHHSSPQDQVASLRDLMRRMGCKLVTLEGDEVLDVLAGRHLHVWRDTDGYSVLIPDQDPRIGAALRQIAASEAGCDAHSEPEVEATADGFVFSARGDNAFLFAQFFLALEQAPAAG